MSDKPVFYFVVSRAIFLAVGSFLLAGGILTLLRQQGGWLFGGSILLLGACALSVTFQSFAEVFRGKPILEQIITLPFPGTAAFELTAPKHMRGGRVILFFQDTTERYAGKVTLTKVPSDVASPVSVALLRIEPWRIKVPKWSPTSDAGEVLEAWPRGTGGAADPVVLKFSYPVRSKEKLRLEFELESNFKGTELERHFPITGKATVRVAVKE